MKTKPSSEYVLLGAMMLGPKHGYDILKFLDSALESTWYVSTSQLYALLKKLEAEGLLDSTIHAQDARPSKRVFSVSPAGKKTFLDWVYSPTDHVRDLRIEFLAKLFFLHRLSLKGGSRLIEKQCKILEEIRKSIQHRKRREKDPYDLLVLESKIVSVEAWLRWLITHAKPFTAGVGQ